MTEQSKTRSEMPAAVSVPPVELAGYQTGAVVSRTLLKRTGGNITLFAFDEGQGLSEHTAPFGALAHILEGNAEIIISGKPLHVAAGEMVLMPAHQPHALNALTKVKLLLTMIRSA